MPMTAAQAQSISDVPIAAADAAHDDRVLTLRLDAGVAAPGAPALNSAVEIRVPADVQRPAIALVCLPGGGMNKRFFDLIDRDDASFSFARAMSARGFVMVMVDHLGIGDSDRPEDLETLTPERIVSANACVVDRVLDGLRAGTLAIDLPALPELRSIGVGHSMGAMLTILQQTARAQHAALCLLGFSTRGLPEYLSAEVCALAQDQKAVRAQLVAVARENFARPPAGTPGAAQNTDFFAAAKAELRGVQALRRALDKMLTIPAFLAMLPGNVAEEAARIAVPVFIGLGELDITGPADDVVAAFGGSAAVTLHILPQAGHSHFIFAARRGLFERFAQWARALPKSS